MPDENTTVDGQGENEQTTGGQQQVDWSKVDWSKAPIPEDAIKSSKLYRDVLDESVKRRQRIADLKAAMEKDEPEENKTEQVKPEQAGTTQEIPTWAQEFMQAFKTVQQELALTKREAMVKSALTKYRLSEDVTEFIHGDTEADIMASAEKLSKLTKTYPQIGATNSDGEVDTNKDMLKRVVAVMENKGGTSPFDTGLQSQLGGGAIKVTK